jgi:hypothetical protein
MKPHAGQSLPPDENDHLISHFVAITPGGKYSKICISGVGIEYFELFSDVK